VEAVAPEPEQEAEVRSAGPADGLDEFDLEYFSDEAAAPVADAPQDVAFEEEVGEEGLVDLEADMDLLMESQGLSAAGIPETHPAEAAPDTPETPVVEEYSEAVLEPATEGEEDWLVELPAEEPAEPAVDASTGPPPPWALALMEEMRRLRAENCGLRDALRGIRGLLDRQISVLQEGREELERHVGDDPGESAP